MLRALIIFLLPLLLLHFDLEAHPAVKRLQYGRDWNYQPILINGEEVMSSSNRSGGSQVAAERYEAIKKVLKQYERPFTVLDLGANNGYFSLKIAEEFDAVCVLVDGTDRLADICTLNTERNKIIYFQKMFNKHEISLLAQREHFDVVLALLVLHHVDDWKTWINSLFQLGDHVIIETPGLDDHINPSSKTRSITSYLLRQPHGVEIGSFPRGSSHDHLLWFCQNPQFRESHTNRLGIDPETFFLFNGTFPSKSYVQALKTKIEKKHVGKRWLLQGIDYILD